MRFHKNVNKNILYIEGACRARVFFHFFQSTMRRPAT
jgi:hypothetical protein